MMAKIRRLFKGLTVTSLFPSRGTATFAIGDRHVMLHSGDKTVVLALAYYRTEDGRGIFGKTKTQDGFNHSAPDIAKLFMSMGKMSARELDAFERWFDEARGCYSLENDVYQLKAAAERLGYAVSKVSK